MFTNGLLNGGHWFKAACRSPREKQLRASAEHDDNVTGDMLMDKKCLCQTLVAPPAAKDQTPTRNQVRELGKCGGFPCPSSALKPRHREHERKSETRGDLDQD